MPVKYEHIVFCKLTPLQTELYNSFNTSKEIKKLLEGVGTQQPLKAITSLKKLCNHPVLIANVEGQSNFGTSSRSSGKKVRPAESKDVDMNLFPDEFDFGKCQSQYSGKMALLEKMLVKIK